LVSKDVLLERHPHLYDHPQLGSDTVLTHESTD
jgi:hypothetical protein